MRLFFIRHGETDANEQLIIQGRTNNPLNNNGINSAHNISDFFSDIDINKIYHTSLIRTKQTLDVILNNNPHIDAPISINDNFIERDFGYLDGKSVDSYYNTKDFSKVENFEHNNSIENRVINGLSDIIDEHKYGENIMVLCHSHTMKSLLVKLFGDNYDYTYKLKNCAIIELEHKDESFNLIDIH